MRDFDSRAAQPASATILSKRIRKRITILIWKMDCGTLVIRTALATQFLARAGDGLLEVLATRILRRQQLEQPLPLDQRLAVVALLVGREAQEPECIRMRRFEFMEAVI